MSVPLAHAPNRHVAAALALAAGVLAAGGCEALGLGRQCEGEYHGVGAGAQVGATATSPATLIVGIMVSDPRDDPWVSWSVLSASLKPQTTRAELRDASDGSHLFTFPLAPGDGPSISAADHAPYDGVVPIADLRARLGAGRGVLELTTSLADQRLIRVPLTPGSGSNYGRSNCR